MPLIVCPDCESKVSDSAGSCPNCGRPMTGDGENGPQSRETRTNEQESVRDGTTPQSEESSGAVPDQSRFRFALTKKQALVGLFGLVGFVVVLRLAMGLDGNAGWLDRRTSTPRPSYPPNSWAPRPLPLFAEMDEATARGEEILPCEVFHAEAQEGSSWLRVMTREGPVGFVQGPVHTFPYSDMTGGFSALRERVKGMTELQRDRFLEETLPGRCVAWQGWVESVSKSSEGPGYAVRIDMDSPDVSLSVGDVGLVIDSEQEAYSLTEDGRVWVSGVVESTAFFMGSLVVNLREGWVR